MSQLCKPLYLVHTNQGHSLTPMAWRGNCVIVAVDASTPSDRAGTGTLSQRIFPYYSLEYPHTVGGTGSEGEGMKMQQ